ncbi:hypothetical protein P43SY_003357 [Pythium insidiosum]|uniref:Protein kinase domain-containing protein n=1 Tax=Pythium insidiosum TaxID=114742 RepID=A0AAD5Q3W3_PYTIN|nr:hypothetical protein P43SY_003357 [Pythium insidiosum]
MAPEIINGKAGQASYGEAADVYSLGITMWDILYPGQDKYPSAAGNQFRIFELVTEGTRPELDPTLHHSLRMVIESAWHGDPRLRPSAQNVVSILETIQEEIAAVFAAELSDELEEEMAVNKQGKTIEQSFTGEHAVEQMEELSYVSSTSEAIRLGNALLDAGLLHHVKHARPFENTTSMYYFDEDNINLCQPIAVGAYDGKLRKDDDTMTIATTMTRRTRRTHRTSSTHGNQLSEHLYGSSGGSHSEQTLLENGICACRKLGQRLALPKNPSRRRFRRKYKAIAEESVLQASLLDDDHMTNQPDLLRHSHNTNEFEEFDAFHPAPSSGPSAA